MLQKIFSTGILCLSLSMMAKAQTASTESMTETPFILQSEGPEDPKPALTITGSADAYLRYDFNKQLSNN